jgi:adenosine deaminase CECR1
MNLAKEKQICIETCPISNEILRLTASILSHPLPELVAHGVPTTINNDDPGILGQEDSGSLSHDYWQALQAFGNFGLSGIGSLARTSVKFATYDDHMDLESKYRLRKLGLWDTKWEEFCRWVVETFGEWEK